jgi:HPt (histidine-containing phosphotransfer) domain-containing protein
VSAGAAWGGVSRRPNAGSGLLLVSAGQRLRRARKRDIMLIWNNQATERLCPHLRGAKRRRLQRRMQNKGGSVIDSSALERIDAIGGPALVGKMIQLLLSNAPERLEKALGGHRDGDLRAVEEATHSLKSSAGNLGASELQRLAGEAEELAEARQEAGLKELLDDLAAEWGRVRDELKVVQGGLAS